MPDATQGSWGRLADLALPALALGTGIFSRPDSNAPYSLALLFRMIEAQRERAQEQAGAAAAARALGEMGLKADPSMTAANQVALANAQIVLASAKRQTEKEARAVAEELRGRQVHGQMAGVQARIGQELPDVLTAELAKLAPDVGRTAELKTGFGQTLTDIRESAKRLETARALARPFEETTTVDLAPRVGQVPPGPAVSLSAGEDLPMPVPEGLTFGVGPLEGAPMSLTTVPENVHALQRLVMATGAAPTPEQAHALFNIPLSQYPGGAKALTEQVKPPYRPETFFATGPTGTVTPIITQTDPRTGQPVTITGTAQVGAGTPQKPERPAAHELAQSLGFVILGQSDKAMKEHQGLSVDQAQRLRTIIAQADQQVTPQLAASVLSLQIEDLDEGLKRLDSKIGAAKSDRERMTLETERTQRKIERDALKSALRRYATPGPLSANPPPAPAGATRIDPSRLREAGIIR